MRCFSCGVMARSAGYPQLGSAYHLLRREDESEKVSTKTLNTKLTAHANAPRPSLSDEYLISTQPQNQKWRTASTCMQEITCPLCLALPSLPSNESNQIGSMLCWPAPVKLSFFPHRHCAPGVQRASLCRSPGSIRRRQPRRRGKESHNRIAGRAKMRPKHARKEQKRHPSLVFIKILVVAILMAPQARSFRCSALSRNGRGGKKRNGLRTDKRWNLASRFSN